MGACWVHEDSVSVLLAVLVGMEAMNEAYDGGLLGT
jgi:hypothetical protein